MGITDELMLASQEHNVRGVFGSPLIRSTSAGQAAAGRRVDATSPLAMRPFVVIITQRLEPVERWERIATILERHDVVHLDRLDQAPMVPAWLTQVID